MDCSAAFCKGFQSFINTNSEGPFSALVGFLRVFSESRSPSQGTRTEKGLKKLVFISKLVRSLYIFDLQHMDCGVTFCNGFYILEQQF
jgi:hypothetical protein